MNYQEEGAYLMARIRAGSRDDGGCWIWNGHCNRKVFPIISIKSMPKGARRAAWEATNGAVKPGYEVIAACESVLCVNPDHLEVVTVGERRKRMAATRGQRPSAEKVMAARARGKLTMEIAREIRASDEMGKDLATKYGVSHTLISYVRQGKSWAEPSPWNGLGARQGAGA